MTKIDQILAKALVEEGLLSQGAYETVCRQASAGEGSVLASVVSKGLAGEEQCLRLLAERLGLSFVDLKGFRVPKQVLDKVPVKIAAYYHFFPLKISERTLTVAAPFPFDVKIEDEIRMQLGLDIDVALGLASEIARMLKENYGVGAETIGEILLHAPQEAASLTSSSSDEKIDDIEKQAQDASVINLVNQILLDAYKRRATDIHIEPYRSKVRLRYRIDGVLYDANISADIKQFLSAILSRIKIMSNLNIVERRLAQDGRAIVKTQDQNLDLRVSFIPTPYGESVVIRILPSKMLFSLEKLGLSGEELGAFEGFIRKPHGIIFVTGPTGSGKTTTLYACLSRINTNERKIITIEDPIEYEMEGITQIQVMPEIGWTFAKGLRSMLRHDPDVMMVGEVRDLETAEIAIRVALTGHLVLSTLHTNDAPSGITRLIDIGLEPYLVSSSVESFIAQRLVRVICPGCKKELLFESDDLILSELRRQIAQDLGLESPKAARIYRGEGCADCNGTGFFGRTAIYEILTVDHVIRELIVKKASSAQIKRIAISRGMRTLRQDGWLKVMQGFTTVDEVMRVTQAEESGSFSLAVSASAQEDAGPGAATSAVDGKRAYVRLESRVNVRYKTFKSLSEISRKGFKPEQMSATANVSAGGILFFSSEPLSVGSVAELKLELPDGSDPISCIAKVVRTEEIEPEKKYRIAIQFLDITSSDRARVNKFVLE